MTFCIKIRVPKSESAFTYFILESMEGTCFYSTLEYEKGASFRDIEISGSEEYRPAIENTITQLSKKFQILRLD